MRRSTMFLPQVIKSARVMKKAGKYLIHVYIYLCVYIYIYMNIYDVCK